MTKLMYDSINAGSIPLSAEVVAGYGDGSFTWSSTDWARFPGAIAVSIVVDPADQGDVLDVERYDASPADCPGWIARYDRPVFKVPTLYCSRSDRAAVEAACKGLVYDLWIATLDGTQDVPGAAAVQYLNTPGYDVSICQPWWPRVPGGPQPPASGGTMQIQDSVSGVSVSGVVYDPTGQVRPQQWLNWSDLSPVAGQVVPAGTGVTWTEAKKVGDVWYDRIEKPDGSPGDWCLPDSVVNDGGFDPTHFRPSPPVVPPVQPPQPPDLIAEVAALRTDVDALKSKLATLTFHTHNVTVSGTTST